MAEKSYYETLGVNKNANADEVKSAYRRMAKKYHPDLYNGKTDSEKKVAEAKFKEVSHAYNILSDTQKRESYDTYGNENGPMGGGFGGGGAGSSGFGFDVDDIFSSIFSGFGGGGRTNRANAPQRGQDIMYGISLTFEEAAFGVEKSINIKRIENCSDCRGTGARGGTAFSTCTRCNGTGQVTQMQRTPFGQFSTASVCPSCKGLGKGITDICPTCKGQGRYEKAREVKINVPAGIDSGQRVTYQNEGSAGKNGGNKGGLILEINIRPHKFFRRNGADVKLELPISFVDAILGCSISVPTLTKSHDLKIPEGTQSETVFRIKGFGMKKIREHGKGDMFVKVIVEVPKNVSREQKDLLKKLSISFDGKQFPKKKQYKESQE